MNAGLVGKEFLTLTRPDYLAWPHKGQDGDTPLGAALAHYTNKSQPSHLAGVPHLSFCPNEPTVWPCMQRQGHGPRAVAPGGRWGP
jgi:hypothetical protein